MKRKLLVTVDCMDKCCGACPFHGLTHTEFRPLKEDKK